MKFIKYIRNKNGTYGPTSEGDFYISKSDHKKNAKKSEDKTRWNIVEHGEYNYFKLANEEKWFCHKNNCYFSFDLNSILGENGERIAKFPNDRNVIDPWHGYPVNSSAKQNRPSQELLESIDEKYLPRHFRLKIERGSI